MEKRGDISEKTPDLNAKLAEKVAASGPAQTPTKAELDRLDMDFTKKAADKAAASI